MLRVILVVFVTLFVASSFALGTNVCGSVSGTWTLSGSPYYVNCNITVGSGQTLNIEPGVQVLFTGHYRFNVYGTLRALGTISDSIIFSRAYATEQSKWWGFRMVGSSASNTRLEYCVIEYGHATGSDYDMCGGGLSALQCSPTVTHSTFRYNQADYAGGAISLDTGSPVFSYCIFTKNTSSYGAINCWHSNAQILNCTISNNFGSAQGGAARVGSSSCLFRNVIFAYSTGSGITYAAGAPYGTMDHCDLYGNSAANFAGDPPAGLGQIVGVNGNGDPCDVYSNILLNPHFLNATSADYRLAANSPCIDAGNPSSLHDPDGTIADIGALYRPSTGSGEAFVSLISAGPPDWGYRLTCSGGAVDEVIFTNFCPGTTGWLSGDAVEDWQVLNNGDGNNGDSIIFRAVFPMMAGQVDRFNLSHPTCDAQVRWCAADSCGNIDGPLPVELLSFTATPGDRLVTLFWATASETDVSHFEVLRDGVLIMALPAAGGNATGAEYRRNDTELVNGREYYYTLTAVDVNGTREILSQVSATPRASGIDPLAYQLYTNYPNPFNPTTSISFDIVDAGHVNLMVYNLMGQEVASLVNGQMTSGRHIVSFDAANLPSGVYVYRLNVNGFVSEKKMLLMK
jgi:hypothetical protein